MKICSLIKKPRRTRKKNQKRSNSLLKNKPQLPSKQLLNRRLSNNNNNKELLSQWQRWLPNRLRRLPLRARLRLLL
jgi:hypothetical protein